MMPAPAGGGAGGAQNPDCGGRCGDPTSVLVDPDFSM